MSNNFPDSVVSLLQKMVGFDTINSHISGVPNAERELAIYLESYAQNEGWSTQRLPIDDTENGDFNLLITLEINESQPWLLFESHLDVVTIEGMTIEPFAAKIEDGKIYGRGVCDTKASGAAMIFALKRYRKNQQLQTSQANNIAIIFTCDEEVMKKGALTFAHRHLPNLGFKPEGVIVGEPTMLQPIVAHNGVTRILVRTHGVAAHSSNPANGRSAISEMVKVIQLLESEYIPSLTAMHELTGKAQSSINTIRAGRQTNIIPDLCEISIDRRVVPGEKTEDILPQIERVLAPLQAANPDAGIEIEIGFLDPSLSPREGAFTDFVNRVLAHFGDVTPQGVPYGTDASNFDEVGLNAIVLGPGHISQAHTKDEWIEIAQVEKAVEVYFSLMSTPFTKI